MSSTNCLAMRNDALFVILFSIILIIFEMRVLARFDARCNFWYDVRALIVVRLRRNFSVVPHAALTVVCSLFV